MSKPKQKILNPPASLLLETTETRWQNYRAQLKRCRDEASEEAVHDLRVATRRLLALVDLIRTFAPHPRLQKLRRVLKDQLDDFDDLRDTQVALVEIAETLPQLPELVPLQEVLKKQEKRLLRQTAKAIRAFKLVAVKNRMDFVYKSLLGQADNKHLEANLFQAIDDTFDEVLRRYRRIDAAQVATIHRTRIAFKKFRYTLEILHPIIPDFPADNLLKMHEFQGAMGDIQDAQVFLEIFETFAGDADSAYDPEPVRRYYRQRHTDAITHFIGLMDQVTAFWRATPNESYPWQVATPGSVIP